ncbi:hypothetical protein ZWY2020_056907 [Hordeum vulgare]|nr:hypothetical protein ZWY2020_056907 [Hordeum vulgare]
MWVAEVVQVLVGEVVQVVALPWAENSAVVDVVVQVVALLWAEDLAVVDVVVQVLVVVLVVEEVLQVEARVVVEECSDTYKDHFRMASSQPNKAIMKGVEDTEGGGEMLGCWDKVVKKVREEDAAALAKKKEEELEKKREEDWIMTCRGLDMEKRPKKQVKMAEEKRMKEFRERTTKLWALDAAKKERAYKRFIENVVQEASLIRKREEEEEEEERKKKKGKGLGPCSTQ